MARLQFRLRSISMVCFFVAVVGAWVHDRNRLVEQLRIADEALVKQHREFDAYRAEAIGHRSRHASARLAVVKELSGPFTSLSSCDSQVAVSPETLSTLSALGVEMFVDQSGNVVLANVPDTTNFQEAFLELRTFPTLRFVHFTTGPLPPGYDWDSSEFREAYATAAAGPILRTFALSEQFRIDAYDELRKQLPHVESTEWMGAF